jgi:hypothetical protein
LAKEKQIAIDASVQNANIMISVKAFHEFCKAFLNAFLATQIDSGESSRQLTAQSSMGRDFVFSLPQISSQLRRKHLKWSNTESCFI